MFEHFLHGMLVLPLYMDVISNKVATVLIPGQDVRAAFVQHVRKGGAAVVAQSLEPGL